MDVVDAGVNSREEIGSKLEINGDRTVTYAFNSCDLLTTFPVTLPSTKDWAFSNLMCIYTDFIINI